MNTLIDTSVWSLALRRQPNWPDPALPATVERQTWDVHQDPVLRLGAWLKGGGA